MTLPAHSHSSSDPHKPGHHHDHENEPEHNHSHHGHHHFPTGESGQKRLMWLTGLSAVYMVAEIVGGMVSSSLALLADAGHMAVDVGAMALSLFAIWISKKPPTPGKTYGYIRAEILAALVNGALLAAASVWICYEAIERVNDPHQVEGKLMGLVATGGLFINLLGLWMIRHEHKGNLNFRGIYLHLLTDMLGSVGAMVAAAAVVWLGWQWADSAISVFIALFILYGSWKLLSDCVNVLLEGVPKGMDVTAIRNGLESFPAVDEVHDLHVWCVTSGVPALSAHVRIKEHVDHGQALNGVIELLKNQFHIEHVTLQLEPAVFDHSDDTHLHP